MDSEYSLLALSNIDRERLQSDGWGIAWRDGADIRLSKGIAGAYEVGERGPFLDVAGKARGPLVVAHIRAASNPMNLPLERLRSLENSQPFLDADRLFAHNGSIPLPRETREWLGRYASSPKGLNDSEVLFYLLLKCFEEEKDLPQAYVAVIRSLEEVWKKHGKGGPHPPSGLNVLFSQSDTDLWAFCHYTGDHGHSMSGFPIPYYEMCYRMEKGAVVVSSEPMDHKRDSWMSLPSGRFLHAERHAGRVDVKNGPIPY